MDENTFHTAADHTLERFFDAIDAQLGDSLEVDLEGGVLTVELENGGSYVINKHAPNRQIWMSSPASGASHFDYDEASGQWLGTRGGGALAAMLAEELAEATGEAVDLS